TLSLIRHSLLPPLFFSLIPRPPRPTLFPYTTLFRSAPVRAPGDVVDLEEAAHLLLQVLLPHVPDRDPVLGLELVGELPEDRVHRSEEHTSELQSLRHLVCRLLLEKKKPNTTERPSDF